MVPVWFHWLSTMSLGTGVVIAAAIAVDEARYPQKMWIMNLVWPIVALFGSLLAAWGYLAFGRATIQRKTPFAVDVAKAACHCGSGCTLGDVVAETLIIAFPGLLLWFGWHSLFEERLFAAWILDFILAFGFGIVFQYYTIVPMRDLSPTQGLVAAIKADTLSLAAWQIGMYGFMAVAHFILFRRILGVSLDATDVEYWFMMQIAMITGFATAYPVNWWLLRRGLKERM
jgi:hypothetical protein